MRSRSLAEEILAARFHLEDSHVHRPDRHHVEQAEARFATMLQNKRHWACGSTGALKARR